MAESRADAYGAALFEVARAEGATERVSDELYKFARALVDNDELRDVLGDPHIPVERRLQVIDELMGGRAEPATVAVVSMVVTAGRARELPAIIDAMVQRAAAEAGRAVAEVRSAVELSPEHRDRLAQALAQATGRNVDVKVIIDPSVLGGVVTTIGDTVIDGSVRHRLEQLRKVI